jgi:hypothetical protein
VRCRLIEFFAAAAVSLSTLALLTSICVASDARSLVPYLWSAPLWLWAGFSLARVFGKRSGSEKTSSALVAIALVCETVPFHFRVNTGALSALVATLPLALLISFLIEARTKGRSHGGSSGDDPN